MANTCNCSSDCLQTVTLPSITSTPGPTGPAGSNGASVLYNEFTESTILTVNSWQNFSVDKAYGVPLTQLNVGDRLIVEATGSAQIPNINNKYVGIKLLFDNNLLTSAVAAMPHPYTGYFKFITTIDVVDVTGNASNIRAYTRYEYSWSDPNIAMVSGEFNIEQKTVTVDYATTPAKILRAQGILYGTTVDATNFVKLNQFCVEYFKKI